MGVWHMPCSSQHLLRPWLYPVLTGNLADCGEFIFFFFSSLHLFLSVSRYTTATISLASCVENFLISGFTWHLFKTQIKCSDFFLTQIKYRGLIVSYRINYLKKAKCTHVQVMLHIKDGGTLKIWSHGACLRPYYVLPECLLGGVHVYMLLNSGPTTCLMIENRYLWGKYCSKPKLLLNRKPASWKKVNSV